MAEPPRKETLSSRISATLRQAILRGELAPGARINLDRLRERHDISISPLREAVARLVADGLVTFEDQRGYRVAPVSMANLDEVTELRAECEVIALRASIGRGDLDWESDVMRALHLLGRAAAGPERAGPEGEGPQPDEAWEAAHGDFHRTLIRGCAMPVLLGFCSVLHNMTERYHRLYPTASPPGRAALAEHEAIALAAIARDAEPACAALRAHVLGAGAELKRRLAVVGDGDPRAN
ncbi:MAG: GntR family transcriptional regulator [Alphaproteobacteria bacterium HGW-Alphaproteobacteria-6]|nr:MAG: GntR family transcriptional regulator [Alphaproteobacteria bacterium HGW-Alphaproteobacteria-6]